MDKDLSLVNPGETRPINTITIDTLEYGHVQLLISAVNNSEIPEEFKKELQEKLSKWDRALTLANHIKVTF